MKKLIWERVEQEGPDGWSRYNFPSLYIARTPEGWLVTANGEVDITYVPDPDATWLIDNNVEWDGDNGEEN